MPQMKQPRQNQKTRRQRPRLPASVRSKLLDELAEVTRHRAAISDVLRAIPSSPHDLQPIFDTILDSARRLCQAEVGTIGVELAEAADPGEKLLPICIPIQHVHDALLFDARRT